MLKFVTDMAYLRKRKKGNGVYYYIVKSVRRNGKIKQKVLEYLGRNPDHKKLKRALWYWRVGSKKAGNRRN